MIRLNCFFKASEGRYDDALEAAIALTAASQTEKGCIAYDVFESATRGEIFMICETWTDEAALEAHSASAHFIEHVATLQECGTLKVEKFAF